jgi:hypothetical protein
VGEIGIRLSKLEGRYTSLTNLLGDFDGVAALLSEVAHMSMTLKSEVLPEIAVLLPPR